MVLIVDDSLKVRLIIRSMIEDLDGDIYECEDGAKALAAFQMYRPDWVFMDLAMQHMNGLDATRQIIEMFPDAKVAIVTDYDDAEIRQAARAAGARGFFNKGNLVGLRRLLIDE